MRIERDQARIMLILFLLTGAFAVGLWWPARQQQQAVQQRIAAAQSKLQNSRDGNNSLIDLVSNVEQTQKILTQRSHHLPTQNEMAPLLRDLVTQMSQCHLSNHQVLPRNVIQGIEYSMIPLRLDFDGRFSDVFAFLRQIETTSRLIRIQRLDIQPDNSRSPSGNVHATIEFAAFFAPVSQEPQP